MERDLRKRENRAKKRGHSHRGGRGGFRPRAEKQNLQSNEWRFEEITEDTENMLLRKATMDACSMMHPTVERDIRSCVPEEEAKLMNEILSKLSLDEQTTQEFIVPVPKLSAVLKPEAPKVVKVQEKPADPKPEPKPANKTQDLDAWLDGLLG